MNGRKVTWVREVMTKEASYCKPESTLEEATFLMGKGNCGFLPGWETAAT